MDINQSLIKKFFYKGVVRDYCPYSIYCDSIAKTHNRSTEAMTAGSYFETLCLGSGINGQKTLDMKRKKLTTKQILEKQTIGSKTIDQERVEKQALNFERLCSIYQISVQKELNTQVKIVKRWSENDNIFMIGELDLFPTTILLPERGLRMAAIDQKLTGRFSTYGEFCWGDPENLDKVQGYMYHELIRDIDLQLNIDYNPDTKLQYLYTGPVKQQLEKNDPLFFFWVFNYKEAELNNKFIEVEYNPTGRAELYQSMRGTIEEINKNERKGWTICNPTAVNCGNCPNISCEQKIVFKPTDEVENFTKI